MQLSETEKIAFAHMRTLDAQVQTMYRHILSEIEARLGLGAGAIGTTHLLDADSGEVIPRPVATQEAGAEPVTPEKGVLTDDCEGRVFE